MFLTNLRIAILLSAITLLLVSLALADVTEEPKPTQETTTPPRSLLSITQEESLTLRPMDQEIRALLIKERADVAALTDLLKTTHDNMRALQIQKEIGIKKQQAEIGIMEVQAKYAQQAGRQDQATAIREAITGMKERLAIDSADIEAEK